MYFHTYLSRTFQFQSLMLKRPEMIVVTATHDDTEAFNLEVGERF